MSGNSWMSLDLEPLGPSKYNGPLVRRDPDDYVSIRYGYKEVSICCHRHHHVVIALLAELMSLPQELLDIQTLKRYDKAGVPIKHQLSCICCLPMVEKQKDVLEL